MNIVILHHFDYPEGMATTKRFQLFADYFQQMNCRVTFVLKTHKINSPLVESGENKGFRYFKINFEKKRKYPFYYDKKQNNSVLNIINEQYINNKRNILLTGGISPEFYLIVRKLIPTWELYCDYVEDYTAIGTIFSELKKIDFFRYIKSKIATILYQPLEKHTEYYMFKNANGISAISPYLFAKAQIKHKNVVSIPITANKINSFEKTSSKTVKTIFFAGSGSMKDGMEMIAMAFSSISTVHNVCLKISGNITNDGKQIINKYCKGNNNVIFLGFLSDKDYFEELSNADILLMTRNNSRFAQAGFPYKLGEYLSTSNPVIATNVSGIDQYLMHKKSALIIAPDNVNALIESISFLIDNPIEASQIGKEGCKVFEEHFNAEKNCMKFYEFITATSAQ